MININAIKEEFIAELDNCAVESRAEAKELIKAFLTTYAKTDAESEELNGTLESALEDHLEQLAELRDIANYEDEDDSDEFGC